MTTPPDPVEAVVRLIAIRARSGSPRLSESAYCRAVPARLRTLFPAAWLLALTRGHIVAVKAAQRTQSRYVAGPVSAEHLFVGLALEAITDRANDPGIVKRSLDSYRTSLDPDVRPYFHLAWPIAVQQRRVVPVAAHHANEVRWLAP